jgi:hypothetical protein
MSTSDEHGGELDALTPELIGTINQMPHAVLKNCHITIIKQLAKLAECIDIHIQVRPGGKVKILHTEVDFSS